MSNLLEHLQSALAGRYEIEREFGKRASAHVFLHEIQVTSRLQHPFILPMHDSGEADSLPYYVMPYVRLDGLQPGTAADGGGCGAAAGGASFQVTTGP